MNDDTDKIIKAQATKRAISRSANSIRTKGSSSEKLNRKRFGYDVFRRRINVIFPERASKPPLNVRRKSMLLFKSPKKNIILDSIINNRQDLWRPIKLRSEYDKMEIDLNNFSFIDDPVGAVESLYNISSAEMYMYSCTVNFNQNRISDIGPYLILSDVWSDFAPVFTGGRMSHSVMKVIESVGLRKPLFMARFRGLKDTSGVWAFPLQRRIEPVGGLDTKGLNEPQRQEKTIDRFIDWIDECIGIPDIGKELTEEGKGWISNIFNELLDNAERYSSSGTQRGNWSIAGFMAQRGSDEEPLFIISISVLSTGATISETIEKITGINKIRLSKYISKFKSNEYPEEILNTIFALQDYVTSDPKAIAGNRGGIGFQSVFDFMNDVGGSYEIAKLPKLAVVSGNSAIRLVHPYHQGRKRATSPFPREIWFNEQNSEFEAPELGNVKTLPHRIQGTLVTLQFQLDRKYLDDAVERE